MAEPTTAALASATAAASSLAVIATAMGVPAPVVLAAILGAAAAVSMSKRLDMSLRSLAAALGTFALALALGIWGGGFAARVLIGLANGLLPRAEIPLTIADPLCTLLVAMLGQRELLPIGLSMLRSRSAGGAA